MPGARSAVYTQKQYGMQPSSMQSLPEDLRISREHALLGHYDLAMASHSSSIKNIKVHLTTIADANARRQWIKVSNNNVHS